MPSFVYFVIIGIVLAILSPWRDGLFDLGGTIWDIAIGLIARFFLVALLALLIWGVWVSLCWLVASRINSPVAGIVFGTLSPIWIIMSIITIYKGEEEDKKEISWVGFILLIATLVLTFSYYCPTLGKAMANYSSKGEIKLANSLNKKALQMKPEGILSATVLENSVFYDDRGVPKGTVVKKGDEVRTMDLAQVQFENDPEEFVRIMKKNQKGHFRGGETGYVPVRILSFGDEKNDKNESVLKDFQNLKEELSKKITQSSTNAGAGEKLILTLPPAGIKINEYPLEVWLDAGDYRFEPKNSGMKISQIRFVQAGEKNYRNLNGDGESFSVSSGQTVAVRTDWPEIKIYRKG